MVAPFSCAWLLHISKCSINKKTTLGTWNYTRGTSNILTTRSQKFNSPDIPKSLHVETQSVKSKVAHPAFLNMTFIHNIHFPPWLFILVQKSSSDLVGKIWKCRWSPQCNCWNDKRNNISTLKLASPLIVSLQVNTLLWFGEPCAIAPLTFCFRICWMPPDALLY